MTTRNGDKMGDYNFSVRMRRAIERIVDNRIDVKGAKQKFGIVSALDHVNRTAQIVMQGDTNPIQVTFAPSAAPSQVGDLVKVTSTLGKVKIDRVEGSGQSPAGAFDSPWLIDPSNVHRNALGDLSPYFTQYIKKFGVIYNEPGPSHLGRYAWNPNSEMGGNAVGLIRITVHYKTFGDSGPTSQTGIMRYEYYLDTVALGDGTDATGWYLLQPLDRMGSFDGPGKPILEIKPSNGGTQCELRVRYGVAGNFYAFGYAIIECVGEVSQDTSFQVPENYKWTTSGGTQVKATVALDPRRGFWKQPPAFAVSPHTVDSANSFAKLQNGMVSCRVRVTLGAAITVTAASGNTTDTKLATMYDDYVPYTAPWVQGLHAAASDRLISGYITAAGDIYVSITAPNVTLPSGFVLDLGGMYMI